MPDVPILASRTKRPMPLHLCVCVCVCPRARACGVLRQAFLCILVSWKKDMCIRMCNQTNLCVHCIFVKNVRERECVCVCVCVFCVVCVCVCVRARACVYGLEVQTNSCGACLEAGLPVHFIVPKCVCVCVRVFELACMCTLVSPEKEVLMQLALS